MNNYQFYHIYPLGMLDKLEGRDNQRKIKDLKRFTGHLKSMNINGVYLGPVFASEYHGYDTIDFYKVDERLGSEEDLADLTRYWKGEGINTVFDCVFNHVSRQFFAFQDVLEKRQSSVYRDWFHIDWNGNNGYQDGFSYEAWDGHDALVKLNLMNHEVQGHLIGAAKHWIDRYDIEGLRMDAADVMDRGFLKRLVNECKAIKPDFFFIGEMVRDDYASLMSETGMDSTTNYECYKGLYSSLNDRNYHEIAYSLNRQMSKGGMLEGYNMYNFVDNHDVNRVAGQLNQEQHLYPLYLMLYTMKGYPSIYYRSEIGDDAKRNNQSDLMLRKPFELDEIDERAPLLNNIRKLSTIRKYHPAFAYGSYEQLYVDHTLIGYLREYEDRRFIVFINSDDKDSVIDKSIVMHWKEKYGLDGYDMLNDEPITSDHLSVYPNWGRIIC